MAWWKTGKAQGLPQENPIQEQADVAAAVLESRGYCPSCGQESSFRAEDPWLRDHFLCGRCGSLPRERALMAVIEQFRPDWRECALHESSPAPRATSLRLANECPGYQGSQFFPDVAPGTEIDGVRCEDLEALTFADATFDLHVTQDVIEHVLDPDAVFREIARTLKPGGMHIFTVPLVHRERPTLCRARRASDGTLEYLMPPDYHGNPISDQGSLVVHDWGFDLCERIHAVCGLFTHLVHIDDLGRGIRAEYNEILVTRKPGVAGDPAAS